MGLWNSFGSLFKASKIHRQLFTYTSAYPRQNDDAENAIEDGYMYNPDVYSVVNKITKASRTVKWQLYEIKDEDKAKEYRANRLELKDINPIKLNQTKQLAYEEVKDTSVQLYRILKNPNPMQSFADWIESTMGYKLTTGESFNYGVILENGKNQGLINEVWNMPSQLVDIQASKNKVIEQYLLRVNNSNQMSAKFSADEVMHIKYWNPDYSTPEDSLRGLSPIRAGARVVRQSNDAYTANSALLQNSGASGVLSLDPDTVTEETAQALKRDYETQYSGAWNRGKIIIAGAKMDWTQIGLSPVDLNIIESQKMSLRDLCNIYGLSSVLFNDPDSQNSQSYREARKALYMEVVFPELDSIRDMLNGWLVDRYNEINGTSYYIDYDINSVPAIQEDMKLIVDRLWNAWWLTGNEKRNAMGFDADEAMDRFFIPTGMMPMSREQLLDGLGIFDDRGNGNMNSTDEKSMSKLVDGKINTKKY